MITDEDDKFFRDWAKGYCSEPMDSVDVAIYKALGPVRDVLYTGDVIGARILYEECVGRYGTSVHTRYILAEINRYDGRLDEARALYRWVADNAVNDTFVPVKQAALLHWGELELALGNLETAEEVYERAKDNEPEESMFSNMIQGRFQYIKEERDRDKP